MSRRLGQIRANKGPAQRVSVRRGLAGQKSWNGVAILARGAEPVETRRSPPGDRPLHRGGRRRPARRMPVSAERQSGAGPEIRLQAALVRTVDGLLPKSFGQRRAAPISRGTGSSNPSPSSGESGANRNWPAGTSLSSAEAVQAPSSTGGPRVRIRFPPAGSPWRNLTSETFVPEHRLGPRVEDPADYRCLASTSPRLA